MICPRGVEYCQLTANAVAAALGVVLRAGRRGVHGERGGRAQGGQVSELSQEGDLRGDILHQVAFPRIGGVSHGSHPQVKKTPHLWDKKPHCREPHDWQATCAIRTKNK